LRHSFLAGMKYIEAKASFFFSNHCVNQARQEPACTNVSSVKAKAEVSLVIVS